MINSVNSKLCFLFKLQKAQTSPCKVISNFLWCERDHRKFGIDYSQQSKMTIFDEIRFLTQFLFLTPKWLWHEPTYLNTFIHLKSLGPWIWMSFIIFVMLKKSGTKQKFQTEKIQRSCILQYLSQFSPGRVVMVMWGAFPAF